MISLHLTLVFTSLISFHCVENGLFNFKKSFEPQQFMAAKFHHRQKIHFEIEKKTWKPQVLQLEQDTPTGWHHLTLYDPFFGSKLGPKWNKKPFSYDKLKHATDWLEWNSNFVIVQFNKVARHFYQLTSTLNEVRHPPGAQLPLMVLAPPATHSFPTCIKTCRC